MSYQMMNMHLTSDINIEIFKFVFFNYFIIACIRILQISSIPIRTRTVPIPKLFFSVISGVILSFYEGSLVSLISLIIIYFGNYNINFWISPVYAFITVLIMFFY